MTGAKIRVKGVLADFPTSILRNIRGKRTREGLIKLHLLVSGNTDSVSLNLGGGQHGHLALTMKREDYAAHKGFVFVPPHNPDDYLPTMVKIQDQALGTEKF